MTINRTTQPEGERMALKPCPFCGDPDVSMSANRVNERATIWAVVCTACDAEGPYDYAEERATDNWNTRKTSRGGKA